MEIGGDNVPIIMATWIAGRLQAERELLCGYTTTHKIPSV